jgi:MFS family permease
MSAAPSAAPAELGTGPSAPLPGARLALSLLILINLFNYLDRYVLASVLPKLEIDPAFEGVTKNQLGWLTTAFMVSYMLLSPVFGWLGDRMSRWFLVGVGVMGWSLASGGSGLALGFTMMLATRCLIGVGEAAYGPAAPSLLSDLYPVNHRGWVMAWFYMAIPVGSALGYVLGGTVADLPGWGWRWAFYLVVIPGIFLGVWSVFMPEPARGQAEAAGVSHAPHLRDVAVFARIPSYVYCTVGYTLLTFGVGGIGVWMPTYVYEREARFAWTPEARAALASLRMPPPPELLDRLARALPAEPTGGVEYKARLTESLSAEERREYRAEILEKSATADSLKLGTINTYFGAILAVGGLTATLAGGWLGDRLRPRFPGSYFLVSGWSALAALPLVLGVMWLPFPAAWICLFGAIFGLFMSTGPVNTILANVSPPALRSSGFALNILCIHALGDAISPPVIGAVADVSSLAVGFLVVSAFILLAGVFWLLGSRHLQRDTALAPTRLG